MKQESPRVVRSSTLHYFPKRVRQVISRAQSSRVKEQSPHAFTDVRSRNFVELHDSLFGTLGQSHGLPLYPKTLLPTYVILIASLNLQSQSGLFYFQNGIL